MADDQGFFDADEARAHRKARAEWLAAERAALAELKVRKLRQELIGDVRVNGQTLSNSDVEHICDTFGNACGNARLIHRQAGDEAEQNQFQHPRTGGGVFQDFKLLVGHWLVLLRLRQPKRPVDSTQAKAAKEVA